MNFYQESSKVKPIQVLLIEDNPADADLAQETLSGSRLLIELNVVMDGVSAIQYLNREGEYSQAVIPDLILLDLNIPKKDGLSVLAEIRESDVLKTIPIVILTSSDADRDIAESYALGANCYVRKPVGLGPFQEIVRAIEGFWFTIVKLPSR